MNWHKKNGIVGIIGIVGVFLFLSACATKIVPPTVSGNVPQPSVVASQSTVTPPSAPILSPPSSAAIPSPAETREIGTGMTIPSPVVSAAPEVRSYRATGLANSYPLSAHGQATASGIAHDAQGLIAAHATLPLLSQVWVQHGQRRKLVTITDRLNARSEKELIRVSYQVARDLGLDATRGSVVSLRGVAGSARDKGKISALSMPGKKSPNSSNPSNSLNSNLVQLQIGAFAEARNAQQLQRQLQSQFAYPITIKMTDSPHRFYRVYLGPIPRSAIADISAQLQRHHITPLLRD